jgi:hypothetical protein
VVRLTREFQQVIRKAGFLKHNRAKRVIQNVTVVDACSLFLIAQQPVKR